MAGVRLLVGDRVLGVVVGGLAVAVVATVLVNVADVFFVTGPLHGGAGTFGLLAGTWMAGMLAGSRLAGRFDGTRTLAVVLGVSGLVLGAGVGVPAAWPVLPVALAGFALGGAGNGMQNVCLQAVVRLRAPEAVRGRAFAAVGAVLQVAVTTGTLAGAGVVTAAGPRGTFAIAAAGTAVAALSALAVATRTRPATTPINVTD